jgi:hypothetical protein
MVGELRGWHHVLHFFPDLEPQQDTRGPLRERI